MSGANGASDAQEFSSESAAAAMAGGWKRMRGSLLAAQYSPAEPEPQCQHHARAAEDRAEQALPPRVESQAGERAEDARVVPRRDEVAVSEQQFRRDDGGQRGGRRITQPFAQPVRHRQILFREQEERPREERHDAHSQGREEDFERAHALCLARAARAWSTTTPNATAAAMATTLFN